MQVASQVVGGKFRHGVTSVLRALPVLPLSWSDASQEQALSLHVLAPICLYKVFLHVSRSFLWGSHVSLCLNPSLAEIFMVGLLNPAHPHAL